MKTDPAVRLERSWTSADTLRITARHDRRLRCVTVTATVRTAFLHYDHSKTNSFLTFYRATHCMRAQWNINKDAQTLVALVTFAHQTLSYQSSLWLQNINKLLPQLFLLQYLSNTGNKTIRTRIPRTSENNTTAEQQVIKTFYFKHIVHLIKLYNYIIIVI